MPTARILLVDNIPDHAARYEAALLARGYLVHTVSTGRDAVEIARTTPVDCVVIDVRLPDMSGWELCAALKREPATMAVPIMVLTPDTSRAHAVESARVHCNAWLAQPAQADDLVRAIQHMLARDAAEPRSPDEALLGTPVCPACESDRVRATLRVSPIQYYSCHACGHRWRVETL